MTAALLIGGYTGGAGSGIGIEAAACARGTAPTPLGTAAVADSPSFLARHPRLPIVYAVGETAGELRTFAVREGGQRLEPLGEPWPTGESACHVAVDPAGRWLVTSSYGEGLVQLFTLDERGTVTARSDGAPAGAGDAADARLSRAHAALVLPDGRIATTDITRDLLRVWSVREERGAAGAREHALVLDQELALPAGSGPRIPVLHPSGHIHIVTEYSVELLVVAPPGRGGGYTLSGTFPVLPAGERPAAGDSGAHLCLDEAGTRAYVSVRQRNSLHTLAVSEDGAGLHPLAEIGTGGDWPRHHLLHDGLLHVANQRSSTVTSFAIDVDGVPGASLGALATGSPCCVIAL